MKNNKSVIKSEIKSETTSPIKAAIKVGASRQFREGITRVGVVNPVIKGKDTQAKQQNRWTP
jgi:hypothetical protein